MAEEIVNKIAKSGLIQLDLEDFIPKEGKIVLDIKDQLWQGIALKEKEFRNFISDHDWEQYRDKHVAITCSADAIIPTWTYMLLASSLTGIATNVVFGNMGDLNQKLLLDHISEINLEDYKDARVIVKGCGSIPSPEEAFVLLTTKLRPVVKNLMFGEPCSTVPIYKKKPV